MRGELFIRLLFTLVLGFIVLGQEGPCPEGWKRRIYKCYRTFAEEDIDRAATLCDKNDAVLTKITSNGENDFVTTLLFNNSVNMAFISLDDKVQEGVYRWAGLTLVNYTNWKSGIPPVGGEDADCVVVADDGLWHNVSCDQPQSFVCEKNVKTGRSCGLNGTKFSIYN